MISARRLIPYIVAALAFVALEAALIGWVDLPLSIYMRQLDISHPAFVNGFRAITDFGKSFWYLWPLGIGALGCAIGVRVKSLTATRRARLAHSGPQWLFLFMSVALSGLITDFIKPLAGRARPVEFLREGVYGFYPKTFHSAYNSMPSGHSTTAAAMAAGLIIIKNMECSPGNMGYFPRNMIYGLLALILIASRVIVDAHYLSDVLAGSMVGVLTVIALDRRLTPFGKNALMQGLFPIDSG